MERYIFSEIHSLHFIYAETTRCIPLVTASIKYRVTSQEPDVDDEMRYLKQRALKPASEIYRHVMVSSLKIMWE